jgi:hypothetical protein
MELLAKDRKCFDQYYVSTICMSYVCPWASYRAVLSQITILLPNFMSWHIFPKQPFLI